MAGSGASDPNRTLGDLDALAAAAAGTIEQASTTAELERAETATLGRRSPLAEARRALGSLDPEARREAGLVADRLDLTEVVLATVRSPLRRGHRHLVSTTRDALEDVFVAMGFQVAEGPEAETDWYNFEALNIPPAHPARGMYDSFYLEVGEPETVVLRTHTSPVQIRLMEAAVAADSIPIHAVIPGR